MTPRKQLLLLLLIHVVVALAAWDGYRLGLRRGRAEHPAPLPPSLNYVCPLDNLCIDDGHGNITLYPQKSGDVPVPAPPPERTDANWRGN